MRTLADKEDLARERLQYCWEHFGEQAFVGWTGGKDSTVVLALWRAIVLQNSPRAALRALSLDTGCKFSEVLAFRDEMARMWGVQVFIARPEGLRNEYPFAHDPLTCCADLKIAPLKKALQTTGCTALLTGLRADEHAERGASSWRSRHHEPEHWRMAPLLEWTELDIWTFLVREGIPWCSLYDKGYRSLGCRPCTSQSGCGERSGRDARKETGMAQLRSLGYF